MPRYFFVVTYADHQIDDPDGTLLPADTAAIEYARRIINDLREERRPEEPEPSIAVKNAAGEVIYRFPARWYADGDHKTSKWFSTTNGTWDLVRTDFIV